MGKTAVFVFVVLIAATALAHAGHVHNFLGVVKAVDAQHLVITTDEGKQADFVLTKETMYTRNGKAGRWADLTPGLRVAVHVADDGKTAKSVALAGK